MSVFDVETPVGPARIHLDSGDRPRAWLVLGHGAGGGVGAPDLQAAAAAARAERIGVALVEQPYRVAGRRSPAPAAQLDTAWLAVVSWLRERELPGLPLVVGGRSSGARVACRTAEQTGAVGVLCLAFPLVPPRGTASRLGELEAVAVPTLVVQGSRDPFGIPPEGERRTVVEVRGDHSLRSDTPALTAAVRRWLDRILPPLRVERATPADVELCLRIQRASAVAGFQHVFPQDRHPFPEDEIREAWASALADPEVDVFIAYDDGEAVGSVSVGGDYLRTLYVVPGAWDRGIGSLLHDFALDRLREAGVGEARLWTLTENHRARRFYEKRGWRLTGATRVVPFPPNPIDVEYARPI